MKTFLNTANNEHDEVKVAINVNIFAVVPRICTKRREENRSISIPFFYFRVVQ